MKRSMAILSLPLSMGAGARNYPGFSEGGMQNMMQQMQGLPHREPCGEPDPVRGMSATSRYKRKTGVESLQTASTLRATPGTGP